MYQNSINLLIQSPNSVMSDNKIKAQILALKSSLLDHLEVAMYEFFISKDLSHFDPHVGENFCQVRACQVLSLINTFTAKNYSEHYINERITNIRRVKESIKSTLLSLDEHIIIRRYQPQSVRIQLTDKTLKKFLEDNACTCELYEHEIFLLHLYILSHYKKINNVGDVTIDYSKIQDVFKISKTSSLKLIHKYQLHVSDWTCQFVKQIVESSPKLGYLTNILDRLERLDDDGRRMLPLFLTTEILVDNLLCTNATVIVFVERKHNMTFFDNVIMCFKPNHDGSEFIYCGSDINTIITVGNKPCFFVHGIMIYQPNQRVESPTNYIIRFNKVGFTNVIMADSAIHPQYSGNKSSIYKTNPYISLLQDDFVSKKSVSIFHRFNERLAVAKKYGYGRGSTHLLFIKHILCDYPKYRLSA